MNTYSIVFKARRIGALGVMDIWHKQVKADNVDNAVLSLYNEFEHINIVSIHNLTILGEPSCVL